MTTIGRTNLRRVLVANRSEIASRVFRTCRRLGIETVAVHSDPDAELPYVREADHVVHLPGSSPAETYLDIERLLAAARASGADAVHPGYGFLAESADFARAVIDAGLVWIGPRPDAIEAMGSKVDAKRLMAKAGVPILEAPEEPVASDLPLIVKASAGGGGRGMRIVRSLEDLPAAIAAATAEADSAFGDGTVFVEPYVERGRHVEVQVVGTRDGILVLGDRDCSLQRRHQKVVEEAPAPFFPDPRVREALHEAARRAAEAIEYWGAGTVEFLLDEDGDRFFFLEMNTRLQVEHPVTEEVFGVDLVEMQLDVAEGHGFSDLVLREIERRGAPTTEDDDPSQPRGHAIEVRLYAEDPAADYQPQSGLLTCLEIPEEAGVRVESGFETGSTVSTHYDAMLAKVVAHAATRDQAARKLASVLDRARIHGVVTNRDLLVGILRDPAFLAGDLSTAFLDEREIGPASVDLDGAATAAALAIATAAAERRSVQGGIPAGWRNVVSQPHWVDLVAGGVSHRVGWRSTRDGFVVCDGEGADVGDRQVVAVTSERVTLQADGLRTTYAVTLTGLPGHEVADVDWPGGHVRFERTPRFVDPADQVALGSLLAPMPGTVIGIAAEAGRHVRAGEAVLVLEAMKMQHTVSAPHDGVVVELPVSVGDQVAAGAVLAVVQEENPEDPAEAEGDSND